MACTKSNTARSGVSMDSPPLRRDKVIREWSVVEHAPRLLKRIGVARVWWQRQHPPHHVCHDRHFPQLCRVCPVGYPRRWLENALWQLRTGEIKNGQPKRRPTFWHVQPKDVAEMRWWRWRWWLWVGAVVGVGSVADPRCQWQCSHTDLPLLWFAIKVGDAGVGTAQQRADHQHEESSLRLQAETLPLPTDQGHQ
jgi:hypothetical protein